MLSGYRKLRSSHGISYLRDLKIELSELTINSPFHNFLFILLRLPHNSQAYCKQLVKYHCLDNVQFSSRFLFSIGSGTPLILPLPLDYLRFISNQGFTVSFFPSLVLWRIKVFRSYLRSVVLSIKLFILVFSKSYYRSSKNFVNNSIFFFDIPTSFLDAPTINPSFSYIDWVKRKYPNISNILCLNSNFNSYSYSETQIFCTPVPFYIEGLLPKLLFLLFSSLSLVIFFLILFLPSNYIIFSLSLYDLVLLLMSCFAKPKTFSNEYIFLMNWSFTPIWSLFLDNRFHTRISLLFYSVNNEGFSHLGGSHPVPYDQRHFMWPYIYYWNDYHRDFLQCFKYKSTILLHSGPFCAVDSPSLPFTAIPKRSISVFDISVTNVSFRYSLGIQHNYISPSTVISFLSDIYSLCKYHNVFLIYKQKRISSNCDSRYTSFVDHFRNSEYVISVDPKCSPYRLLNATQASISFPFTSVPHYGGTPSLRHVYYDSKSLISQNLSAAQGVPLITGFEALASWFKMNFS